MRPLINIAYNFHWVLPGILARSAQPYAGFYGPFLRRNGIKALLNLRGKHETWAWWIREDRVCRENGIVHFDPTLNSRRLPRREMLVSLLDAFDAAPQPVLIKCSGGQDRTSLAAAIYLVYRFGWEKRDVARAQFSRFPYLHFPKPSQRWLRHFLEFAASETQNGPIGPWIREHYEPERLAAWLAAQGLGDTFDGHYDGR